MFNRLFLIIVCIISFIWISYVAFDLLDQRDKVTPQNIFNNLDGEILVINRPQEVRLDELEFKVNAQMRPILDKLLSVSNLNERFYISQKRPILIIELSTLWDAEILQQFCVSKGIKLTPNAEGSTTDLNELAFEQGLRGRCQQNFLLISLGQINGKGNHDIVWPTWDQKASASIIQLNQPLKSTDVYFKEDGTIAYQTKYYPESNSQKVDDKDLFAQVLPDRLTKYHFYERNYAASIHLIDSASPLYLWSESGFVTFDYRGEPCIIADYIGGQDPFTVIREKAAENDEVIVESKGPELFQYIQITKNFPVEQSAGFYMMYIADKVVLSGSQEACEQIVADYQLGKTVALNEEISQRFYGKLPQKVSERYISGNQAYAKTAYKNILIKTVIAQKATVEKDPKDGRSPRAEQSWSQSISGENTFLLGRSGTQFVWTSSEVIAVSNRKKIARLNFEGTLIGAPTLIDLLDNGSEQVLFNTNSHLYLIDSDGQPHEGFPIKFDNAASNSVSYYRWKGVGNFLVVDEKNRLLHYDNRGRELNILQLGIQNCINPVDVFNQKGILTAVVSGSDRTQTVNMDKHRVLKKYPAIPKERVAVKSPEGPMYYYFDQESWMRSDYTGNVIKLGNYANSTQFKLSEGDNFHYLAFSSYNKIHLFNERGIKMAQLDIPFRELSSYDVLTMQNGKTYVALVDGLENNVYLYDLSGRSFTKKPLEGRGLVLLSESNRHDLVLTTSGNNFIVQYFEILKQKE
jgi:hypothetical protein